MNFEELIEKTELKSGSHKNFEQGSCVMELVSYLANEPWSDHPKCACPVLTSMAIRYNDRVNDEYRQKLKTIIPLLLNSNLPEKKKLRAEFFAHQAIVTFLPILTDALELKDISVKLRSFQLGDWIAARDYINSVRQKIRDAAYAAAAAAAYAAAAADAAAAAAADAAADADAAAAAAADAAADAAAAAAADAAAAAPEKKQFWLDVRSKIWDAWFEVLKQGCEL